MPKRHAVAPIGGEIHQFSSPVWEPLLEIVGNDLSGWFMWMGEIRLDDGLSIHAYKHRETRRYLHLAVDGRAFNYVNAVDIPGGAYIQISRTDALHEAFFNWPAFHEGDTDFERYPEALAVALEAARQDQKIDFDPVLVERQRRFEEAVNAARRNERANDPGFGEVRGDDGNGFYGDMEDPDDDAKAA